MLKVMHDCARSSDALANLGLLLLFSLVVVSLNWLLTFFFTCFMKTAGVRLQNVCPFPVPKYISE